MQSSTHLPRAMLRQGQFVFARGVSSQCASLSTSARLNRPTDPIFPPPPPPRDSPPSSSSLPRPNPRLSSPQRSPSPNRDRDPDSESAYRSLSPNSNLGRLGSDDSFATNKAAFNILGSSLQLQKQQQQQQQQQQGGLPSTFPAGARHSTEDQAKKNVNSRWLGQMRRSWEAGDVYAPRDLSPFEARQSRRRAGVAGDLVDMLGFRPLDNYRNFTFISEFVTEMGRIKPPQLSGLRPVNQRKVAKAIRRAVGMGLSPAIYKHPEIIRRANRGPKEATTTIAHMKGESQY